MRGLVKIIYPGAIGVSVVRSLAPDIDEIIVFGDPDHVRDGIMCGQSKTWNCLGVPRISYGIEP
jgi:hypothetical protein